MKIGDIDVTNSIINLEHDVKVLSQVIDYLFKNNPNNLNKPNQKELREFSDNAREALKKKYPNMGITKKS